MLQDLITDSSLIESSMPNGPKPLHLSGCEVRGPQIVGNLLVCAPAGWSEGQKQAALAWQTGDLVIDVEGQAVYKNGELLLLTKTEFQLLEVLVANSTMFCSRDQLIALICRRLRHSIADNTLSKHICRLRRKLGHNGFTQYLICQNKRGYKWNMVVFTRYIDRQSKMIVPKSSSDGHVVHFDQSANR